MAINPHPSTTPSGGLIDRITKPSLRGLMDVDQPSPFGGLTWIDVDDPVRLPNTVSSGPGPGGESSGNDIQPHSPLLNARPL